MAVKTIGTGGDYTTPQLWDDGSPADISGATGGANTQIWEGRMFNQLFSGTGTQVTMGGTTTDATGFKLLRCQAGASFRDNANVQTNALRYNSSNGAAISGSSGYTTTVSVTDQFSVIDGVQIEASSNSGGSCSLTGANSVIKHSICEHRATDGFQFAANNVAALSSLILTRKSSTGNIAKVAAVTGVIAVNVTFAQPTGLTAPTVAFSGNYGSITMTNCAVFANGCGFKSGSSTYSATTCYTDTTSPPSGFTSATYNTSLFQATADGSHDFRLPSGSALIDNGTTDSTNAPDDIAGTTRPSGSAYDVGAWEFVSASTNLWAQACL